MAVTVTSISSPFADLIRAQWSRIGIRLKHSTAMMYGDYLEAARLRAAHPWLRLSGPKGRLP